DLLKAHIRAKVLPRILDVETAVTLLKGPQLDVVTKSLDTQSSQPLVPEGSPAFGRSFPFAFHLPLVRICDCEPTSLYRLLVHPKSIVLDEDVPTRRRVFRKLRRRVGGSYAYSALLC